jgi:hypothetical protein
MYLSTALADPSPQSHLAFKALAGVSDAKGEQPTGRMMQRSMHGMWG